MMHKNVRLGYMGIPFSNSEAMALEFKREMNWKDAKLVPLMSSADTMNALQAGDIDFAVLACRNSSAGDVLETKKALEDVEYRKVLDGSERICHCLFAKTKDAKIDEICSHIQAIGQCRENISEMYPDAKLTECSDTAYAAQMLSEGKLSGNCAVICRKSAGEHYGLELIKEDFEDSGDNRTYFMMIAL